MGTASLNGSDSLNDELTGGSGNDEINGNAGNDLLVGNAGNDILNGGAGEDTLRAGIGNDVYRVDSAGDQVLEELNAGIDTVQASIHYTLGNHLEHLTLTGQATIGRGNSLNNTLIGNAFNNLLVGGNGNDQLQGDSGNDRLNGGNGRDTLIGGTGRDILVGGRGRDTFLLTSANAADLDIIRDFNSRQDRLAIAKSGFPGLRGTRLRDSQFVVGTGALDRFDRVIYNDRSGALFFDRDGIGGAAQVQIASLSRKPTLGASQIVLR
ncbi:MAG: calcium-binding protein [Leptolyngbyaceae cyanobacterium SL_7_1]|nr:calcium-binding protein [Leptolyngbyaceae cyanobacterium SL_7_1]